MITTADLHRTAREYLRAANLLRTRSSYDAAVYLCGYAVEIALKARICKTLKWTAGFPQSNSEFQGKGNLLKTHSFQLLLQYTAMKDDIFAHLLPEWSEVCLWSPEQRYDAPGTKTRDEADKMIGATQMLLRRLL